MVSETQLRMSAVIIASRVPLLLCPHSYQRKEIHVHKLTCGYPMALGA